MPLRLLYITCENRRQAKSLGLKLLKERLVACVNIISKIETTYWWKGKLESCSEALLLCKTTARNVPKLIRRVKQLHSYEIPCVLALKVEKGNPKYIKWLEGECR